MPIDRYLGKLEGIRTSNKIILPASAPSTDFSLEDLTLSWRVNGVVYRNGIYTVDLLKVLLSHRTSRVQDQWSEYSRNAISNAQFYVGDFPLYYSLFTSLFKNKDSEYKHEIEQAKLFIKESMFKYWLSTLTRIAYTPSGKDRVIHNHGLPDQYEVQEEIRGPDEWVKNASDKRAYKAILDSEDTAEIQAVFNWITEKDAYLWRVNTKPKKIDERVAGFVANSGGADLGCYGNPEYSNPSLGVRRAKIKT
ncbi:hypothetical protein J4471_01005 [Candidatus Woesearchaeota archaeon]|nr:hypothetical protein [Candidatus Woesearchaeota archaeon]